MATQSGRQTQISQQRPHDKGNLDVYVMNADGPGVTQLTDSPGEDRGTSWTSDGELIVFHSARNRDATHTFDIFVMNADGSNETMTSRTGPRPTCAVTARPARSCSTARATR